MIDRFITLLIQKINEYYTCYYEEAPSTTKFPYLVVTTLNVNDLDTGLLAVFDIEVYINELSDITVDSILDTLRDNLNGYAYFEQNLGFHLGFESQLNEKSTEQDLIVRRITFSARIFK